VIHIDRVRTNVDVVGNRPPESGAPQQSMTMAAGSLDRATRDQFRELVLEVLKDHLRDLERRGLL
jgi:hypothetical protein